MLLTAQVLSNDVRCLLAFRLPIWNVADLLNIPLLLCHALFSKERKEGAPRELRFTQTLTRVF